MSAPVAGAPAAGDLASVPGVAGGLAGVGLMLYRVLGRRLGG